MWRARWKRFDQVLSQPEETEFDTAAGMASGGTFADNNGDDNDGDRNTSIASQEQQRTTIKNEMYCILILIGLTFLFLLFELDFFRRKGAVGSLMTMLFSHGKWMKNRNQMSGGGVKAKRECILQCG